MGNIVTFLHGNISLLIDRTLYFRFWIFLQKVDPVRNVSIRRLLHKFTPFCDIVSAHDAVMLTVFFDSGIGEVQIRMY